MSKGDIEKYSKILHLMVEEGIQWDDWKMEAHRGISDLIDVALEHFGIPAEEQNEIRWPFDTQTDAPMQ